MRALISYDNQLQVAEIPRPRASRRGAVVAVQYSGVSFVDLTRASKAATDRMAHPESLVLGQDCVGQVVEVGDSVSASLLGKKVAAIAPHSHAEFVSVPAKFLLPLPDKCSPSNLSGWLLNLTAVRLLLGTMAPITSGMVVVVHAGAGGMGQLLISYAASAGATVIATVGADWKVPFAQRAGASAVLNYSKNAAWAVEVALDLSGGHGADLVLDGVGGPLARDSILALRRMGHFVQFGQAGGKPLLSASDLIPKGLRFSAFSLALQMQCSEVWLRYAKEAVDVAALPDRVMGTGYVSVSGFDSAAEIYGSLQARETVGKYTLRHNR